MTDEQGLEHARRWSELSRDPSTKTGCVIVGRSGGQIGEGFNQVPREMSYEGLSRDERLALTVHAEADALMARGGASIGATAYVWPWPPCAACATMLSLAGVARVVAPEPTGAQRELLGDSWELAGRAYEAAGVELVLVPSQS